MNHKINYEPYVQAFPALKKHLIVTRNGDYRIKDFKDKATNRDLTCAMAWLDFALRLEFPLESLCPTIPSRVEYVRFIEELVGPGERRGIDLGTGFTCIYPLIALRRNPTWTFIALEIDTDSLEYARENVLRNGLEGQITLHLNNRDGKLLPSSMLKGQRYDFLMCNPPFYQDEEQILRQRSQKVLAPNGICSGTSNEMITEGGELHFVRELIKESRKQRRRVKWFTSLIGKRSDAMELRDHLLLLEGVEARLHSFKLGVTTRWILAWQYVN